MQFSELLVLFGVCLAGFIGGLANVIGTICPYMVSYFHSIDASILSNQVLMTSTIAYTFEVSSGLVMSYLSTKFRDIYIMISCLIMSSCLLFACVFITNAYLFFVVFGFTIGVTSNFFGILAVWIGWKHLPVSKRGLVAGLNSSTYILSPFLFGTLFTFVANPDNEPSQIIENIEIVFGPNVYNKFPDSVLWLAISFTVIGVLGAAFLWKKENNALKEAKKSTLNVFNLLQQKNFWYLCALLFFKIFFYYYLLNVYKLVGLYYLKDDFIMSLISTSAFVSCAIFTIVGGLLFDKINWKKLNIIFILIEAFFCVIMPFAFYSSYLYGFCLSIALAISGVSYMSVWLLSERIYKADTWVITVIALTLIIDMSLVNLFQAYVVPVIGYSHSFWLMAVTHLVSLILVINEPERESLDEKHLELKLI